MVRTIVTRIYHDALRFGQGVAFLIQVMMETIGEFMSFITLCFSRVVLLLAKTIRDLAYSFYDLSRAVRDKNDQRDSRCLCYVQLLYLYISHYTTKISSAILWFAEFLLNRVG